VLQTGHGLRQMALLLENIRQVEMGLGIVRLEAHRLADILDGQPCWPT